MTGSEGRGVKQAPFRVLVGAAMPAVLVEVAFISNPDEEKLLASDAYQQKIAASLARGIERFRRERAARLGGGGAVARRAMTPRQADVLTAIGLVGLLATVSLTAPRWAALLRVPAAADRGGRPGRGARSAVVGRRGGRRRAPDQRAPLLRGPRPGGPAPRGAGGGVLARPRPAAPDGPRGARRRLDDGPAAHAPGGDARPRRLRPGAGSRLREPLGRGVVRAARRVEGRAAHRLLGGQHAGDQLSRGRPRADRGERPGRPLAGRARGRLPAPAAGHDAGGAPPALAFDRRPRRASRPRRRRLPPKEAVPDPGPCRRPRRGARAPGRGHSRLRREGGGRAPRRGRAAGGRDRPGGGAPGGAPRPRDDRGVRAHRLRDRGAQGRGGGGRVPGGARGLPAAPGPALRGGRRRPSPGRASRCRRAASSGAPSCSTRRRTGGSPSRARSTTSAAGARPSTPCSGRSRGSPG